MRESCERFKQDSHYVQGMAAVRRRNRVKISGFSAMERTERAGKKTTAKICSEREGFEPPSRFPVNLISSQAPSATRPSLRRAFTTQKNSTIPEKLTSQPPGPPEHIPCSTDSLKQLLSLMNLKRTTPNDTPRKYFSQALL